MACNIKFIKSVHLKYGIYIPREVEHPKKKLVRKRTRFFIDVQLPRFINPIIKMDRLINSIYYMMSPSFGG